MSRVRATALLALALVLQSCMPPEGTRGESGIVLTWENARVFLPGALVGQPSLASSRHRHTPPHTETTPRRWYDFAPPIGLLSLRR